MAQKKVRVRMTKDSVTRLVKSKPPKPTPPMGKAPKPLTAGEVDVLRCIDAYYQVWVHFAQDIELIELARRIRQGGSIASRATRRLKEAGLVSTTGTPIAGGGVAFAATEAGKAVLAQEVQVPESAALWTDADSFETETKRKEG